MARITRAGLSAAEVPLMRGAEVSQQRKFPNWFNEADHG